MSDNCRIQWKQDAATGKIMANVMVTDPSGEMIGQLSIYAEGDAVLQKLLEAVNQTSTVQ